MKKPSGLYFKRFLLLSVLSVLNIVICLSIVTLGTFFSILAVLLAVGNVFILLYMTVKSIRLLVGHVFDKNRLKFEFFYFFNALFSLTVTGLYLFFYFIIILGVMIVLLPFMA